MNNDRPLVGFATVEITGACVGGEKRIDLQVINRSSTITGQPGGGCFGTDCSVVLAK